VTDRVRLAEAAGLPGGRSHFLGATKMEIIKRGVPPTGKLVGTCRACRTKVRCEPYEVSWLSDGPSDQSACHAVNCPVCIPRAWIYLKPEKTRRPS